MLSIVVQQQIQITLLTTQFDVVSEGTALRQEAEPRDERPILKNHDLVVIFVNISHFHVSIRIGKLYEFT